MSEAAESEGVARRVARNTGIRAVAELVGKFASLGFIAVLARQEGPEALGVFVLALAWTELASTPIDMGFDRHFLRLVARDRAQLDRGLYNVLYLKLRRAVPFAGASWLLVWLLDYDDRTVAAVVLLTVVYLLDSASYTLFSAFNGLERADLIGRVLVVQRLLSAALGLAAIALGFGVVGAAGGYVVAAALGLGVAFRLLGRHVGRPRFQLPPGPRAELGRQSLPFAAQEVLSAGLARLDAVLLSVLATQSVVGLYGAAYRLLDATLFISTALCGSFAAMFTYLDETSEPTIRAVFARSLKVSVALLLPCTIALAVLPGPILSLLFGDRFTAATGALRYLAPTVTVLGIVMLCGSLIASRLNPRLLLRCFVIGFVVNLAANLALIPTLGATGAALAMLLCEVVLAAEMLRLCSGAVGAPPVVSTLGAAVAGAAVMAGALALLGPVVPVVLALAAGGLAYLGVYAAVEHRIAPADLAVVTGLLRSRLPSRPGPGAPTGETGQAI